MLIKGAAYISTWCILLWAQGVLAFKFMEVCYGLVTATEIAYYSYLYVMVSDEHYQRVTSFTRAAILLGRFSAYLTGQLLVSFDLMDYRNLNYISFASVCVIFLLALALPRPSHSEIFHQQEQEHNIETDRNTNNQDVKDIVIDLPNDNEKTEMKLFQRGIIFLWHELRVAYSSKIIVIWSCFWAFASCGHLQVQNYIQNLWEVITPEDQKGTIYNGAVEAFGTLISK